MRTYDNLYNSLHSGDRVKIDNEIYSLVMFTSSGRIDLAIFRGQTGEYLVIDNKNIKNYQIEGLN